MRKIPLKKRFSDLTSVWFIIFILFYGLQAIISVFWSKSPPFIDFFTVISILTAAFVLHLRFGFKKTVPICIGIGFIFHIFGLYEIIRAESYITTLYGAPQLNYHYDWIVHSIGFAFFVIAFCSMIYPYFKHAFKNKIIIFFLILFFMLGWGALNEITEYVGYSVFGYGEGFLEFGAGDFSPESGPWENSSMDLISNLTGGVIAVCLFLFFKRYRKI